MGWKTKRSALFLIFAISMLSTASVFAEQAETDFTKPAVPEAARKMPSETTKQDFEPARKFVPSEKLKAEEAGAFPVDIENTRITFYVLGYT